MSSIYLKRSSSVVGNSAGGTLNCLENGASKGMGFLASTIKLRDTGTGRHRHPHLGAMETEAVVTSRSLALPSAHAMETEVYVAWPAQEMVEGTWKALVTAAPAQLLVSETSEIEHHPGHLPSMVQPLPLPTDASGRHLVSPRQPRRVCNSVMSGYLTEIWEQVFLRFWIARSEN